MDVNGTRFHLVLRPDEWLPPAPAAGAAAAAPAGFADGVAWDDKRGALVLEPLQFVFPTRPSERPPTPADRRGAGRDAYGNWYWIDTDPTIIRFLGRGRREAEVFWPRPGAGECPPEDGGFSERRPPKPPRPTRLAGLAVTTEHYLLVGAPDESALLLFDLHAGGPPEWLLWPAELEFHPREIAPTPDGGAWVFTEQRGVLRHTHERLWRLDRWFRVRDLGTPDPALTASEPDFAPAPTSLPSDDGALSPEELRGGPCPPQRIVEDMAVSLARLREIVALDALPDGSALLVAGGTDDLTAHPAWAARLHRFDGTAWSWSWPLFAAEGVPDNVRPLLGRVHDMAFVPPPADSAATLLGTVFVVAPDGNQSFALDVVAREGRERLVFRRAYFPMRRFGGKALVTAGGQPWYDAEQLWAPLAEQPRPFFLATGTLRLPSGPSAAGEPPEQWAFDGREPGCVWHRLVLDACLPAGTGILVESRAADTRTALVAQTWQAEPRPYLRGGGSAAAAGNGAGSGAGSAGLANGAAAPAGNDAATPGRAVRTGEWELLFQAARGRFLQLRLTLTGTGRATPELRALRAWYPRFSYLERYLPAVYREDPVSAWFLDRFLANPEGLFTTWEDRIAAAQVLFDTRTVPADYLAWLADWLGAEPDPTWSEGKQRLFLAHAPQMFRERGTRVGVLRALRLALSDCPDETIFSDDGICDAAGAGAGRVATGDVGCGGCPGAAAAGNGGTATAEGNGAAGGAGVACADPFGVRVVESFLYRTAAGVVFGDAGEDVGPGATTDALQWTPAQGAAPLHRRFREWLAGRYATTDALRAVWGAGLTGPDDPTLMLPARLPADPAQASDWQRFLREGLGFTYAPVDAGSLPLWREYLERSYRHAADLSDAWGLTGSARFTAFADVALPDAIPSGGTRLRDWSYFVSVVAPTAANAHRFTVLVPVSLTDSAVVQQQKLAIARRVAEREKPAHTSARVRLYWAMFRVGEARVGMETVLGNGSRFVAIQLGATAMAAGYLAWTEPWNVRGRLVVGRDRVRFDRPTGTGEP